MLAGLDDVPWDELEHAYGPASDVPDLLRKLTDPDPKIRTGVMSTLYGNVFHQGTRYPATPHVIPFLIELCGSPLIPDRGDLLRFWGSLISGYFSVLERPYWGDGTHVRICGEIQKVEDGDPYSEALHEIYRRSLAERDQLFELMGNEQDAVRSGAAWVLACLPTIAHQSVPELRRHLDQEPSGWVRAAIAFALGELSDVDPLERLRLHDAHPAARCMAACQLARILPTEELIDDLLHFVAESIEGYECIPGAGGNSAGDAAFSITSLPVIVRRKSIPAICERLEKTRSFATMPLVRALLSAAFEPHDEPVTEVNSLQREVLQRMLNSQELWSIGNLYVDFKAYGLPHDREKCAAMIGVRVARDEALSELSIAVTFAEMGFLDKARAGIEKALAADSAVFARTPSPDECWLACATAFAETDPERALQAFRNAEAANPHALRRVNVSWALAELLKSRGID